jgi:hypothetical protein
MERIAFHVMVRPCHGVNPRVMGAVLAHQMNNYDNACSPTSSPSSFDTSVPLI